MSVPRISAVTFYTSVAGVVTEAAKEGVMSEMLYAVLLGDTWE